MQKIAIVYQSKYGSTGQYAKWLKEELICDLYEVSKIKIDDLLKYDTIVFGGGLYASGINGISFLTKNFDKIKDKNIIVFTVGLADPKNEEQFEPILKKNFTEEMLNQIHVFHFRGGIDYKKLGFMHKSMMAMLKSMIKRKGENLTEEDKLLLETYGDKIDFKDIYYMEPLLSYIKNL